MTTCCDDSTDQFWWDQLAVAKAQYIAYGAQILALTSGGIKNYRLATGQTDQSVTRLDLSELRRARQELANEIVTLEARLGCGGSTHVVPNS